MTRHACAIAVTCALAGFLDEPSLAHGGDVKVAGVFTDHAVLQRDMAVPVWGTARQQTDVVVEFAGQKRSATADANGSWRVMLGPMPASVEPREMTISDAQDPAIRVVLQDVLVGEVWVGSGQSNMAYQIFQELMNGDETLVRNAKKTYPHVRLLQMRNPRTVAWQEATPENIQRFSALLFSFAVSLQERLDVPFGLILGAAGGTPSGSWASAAAYVADPGCAAAARNFATTPDYPAIKAGYLAAKKQFEEDDAKWRPAAEASKASRGRVPMPRRPKKPSEIATPGECSEDIGSLFERYIRPIVGYGIRGVLWDQGESGTGVVGVDQFTMMGALIRGWRNEWGQGDFPFVYVQKPSGGGPAWDSADPMSERALRFSPLPETVPPPQAGEYTHAGHLKIMHYPNTFMATTIDLDGGFDKGQHPVIKSGYGKRCAHVALNTVYGGKDEYYGPLYAASEVKDGKVVIRFTHVGKGLTFRHGEQLQGFAVAGDDLKFLWGDAVIQGDTVVVSNPEVAEPAIIRYAWAETFPWANLFNLDGLPAQPFTAEVRSKPAQP